MTSSARAWSSLAVFAVFAATLAGPVPAQDAPAAGAATSAASPLLVPGHWTRDALIRLHAAGLLSADFDPAPSSVGRAEAHGHLRRAAAAARERGSPMAALAAAYLRRFEEEFPATAAPPGDAYGGLVLVDGALSAGYDSHENRILAPQLADGEPTYQEDVSRALGFFDLALHAPSLSLGAFASLKAESDGLRALEAYGVAAFGKLAVWAGRRRPGFGLGHGGAIVVQSGEPLDGAGVHLVDGVRLPGPFRLAGPLRVKTAVSRPGQTGDIESPWFWTFRASVAPHDRVRLGVNRAALFGGRNHEGSLGVRELLKILVGIDTALPREENLENQIASFDLWFTPSLGRLPLALYAEYGVEDLGPRAMNMPAILAGAVLAAVPGAPWLAAGVEWTSFRGRTAAVPWYHHRTFGTWSDRGHLLGHPLGGEGREARVHASADLIDARLRFEGHRFHRSREPNNLYAPNRLGDSRGMQLRGRYRFASRLELIGRWDFERGDDWDELAIFLGGRLLF